MKVTSRFLGIAALSFAGGAIAGPTVPLGTPLGATLGVNLGSLLGVTLGTGLPIVGGGLLAVAAASLGFGIWIVRRKKDR